MNLEWTRGREIPVRLFEPDDHRRTVVVLAHGAGGDQDSTLIVNFRRGLVDAGHAVATFDYPYRAEGRRAPDRRPVLVESHRAVLAWARKSLHASPVIGGVSMGGRMASYLAAEGESCSGLLLLAYPLHPAGRPEQLRSEHLPAIEAPTFLVVGDRDPLCRLDLLYPAIEPMPDVTVVVVPDADHSFRVPKSVGRTREEVIGGVVEAAHLWLDGLDFSS